MGNKSREINNNDKKNAQFDNYYKVFTFENLYNSALKCKRNVGWKGSVQTFMNEALSNVAKLTEELENREFEITHRYNFNTYERGKLRQIQSVHIRERVVQRCLCDNCLSPILEPTFVYDNCASQKNKGTHFALQRLKRHLQKYYHKYGNDGYVLKFDIHNYFGSINRDKLMVMVKKYIHDKNNGGWNSTNLTNVATIILDGLADLGYYPMIYTGYDELAMLSNHIRNDYDCWFAQWYTSPSSYKYNRLGMWQYGGETNYIDSPSISGVGTIDQNIAYKDYPTIIKNGGYNGYKKSSDKDVTPAPTPSGDDKKIEIPSIKYRVRANGKWYGEITNLNDYAGVEGVPITDVMIKPTKGTVKYRVHICGGSWLPYVTGYDVNNDENGYAGDLKPIDAIEVYYYTPADVAKSTGYLRAKYRVSPSYTTNYFEWQYDNETVNGQDGYAGSYGINLDKLQITLAK